MIADQDHNGARATIREVITLVEASRKEILTEIEKLEVKVDAKFDTHIAKHDTEHDTHKVEHQREGDRRAGLIRWAVTTILTGVGTLFAIVWAVSHG